MMMASSTKNWANNLLTQSLLSLKVGSLYLTFAACVLPYLIEKVDLSIFRRVELLGIFITEKRSQEDLRLYSRVRKRATVTL